MNIHIYISKDTFVRQVEFPNTWEIQTTDETDHEEKYQQIMLEMLKCE